MDKSRFEQENVPADGCGSEADPISNYKKAGNKETFTTYNGGFTTHHEIIKKTDTDYTYIYWRTPWRDNEKATQEVTTVDPSYTDSDDEGEVTRQSGFEESIEVGQQWSKGIVQQGQGTLQERQRQSIGQEQPIKQEQQGFRESAGGRRQYAGEINCPTLANEFYNWSQQKLSEVKGR